MPGHRPLRFRVSFARSARIMRLTLKTINDELRRLGHDVHIEKGDGYFYVWKGEANNWLDRTVNVPKVSNLTLEQWIDEFNRLKKVNEEMLSGKIPKNKAADPKSTSTRLWSRNRDRLIGARRKTPIVSHQLRRMAVCHLPIFQS